MPKRTASSKTQSRRAKSSRSSSRSSASQKTRTGYNHPVFGPITEHGEQVRLFQWAKQMSMYAPELSLLYAVPNEKRSGWKEKKDGSRYNPDLTYMLQEGLKGGVPDLCLPVARQGYHSFYIEMKVGDNVPSETQWAWMCALVDQGHRVDICYDADQAIRALCEYLDVQVRFM